MPGLQADYEGKNDYPSNNKRTSQPDDHAE